MKKEDKFMKQILIFIFAVVIFQIAFGFHYYLFTGSEHIIEDKIVDAWYQGESITLTGIEHWWITIEFEDSIPTMYFFTGEQKADNAWNKIEPLIGSNVRLEYKIQYSGNELKYFKGII